jgi:nitrite reductase (NO-forming)
MRDRQPNRYAHFWQGFSLALVILLVSIGCVGGADTTPTATLGTPTRTPTNPQPQQEPTPLSAPPTHATTGQPVSAGNQAGNGGPVTYTPDVKFTLRTEIAEGLLAFVGVGRDIDGETNPPLRVKQGAVAQVTLINGDGAEHDISVPAFKATSDRVMKQGASSIIAFRADQAGEFPYFCTVPGHRQAGMEGTIIVGEEGEEPEPAAASIVQEPTSLPPPVGNRAPRTVKVNLETVELEGQLADGTTYTYWTFGGRVPGPFIRARVGDIVEITLANRPQSTMIHSIDLHAATGPGGGAAVMQVPPGEEKTFTFKALNPGLYVYHCATPMVAHHVAMGMYGLILVEPEGGLPPVDHEFYVMQGEIYTQEAFREEGKKEFGVEKLLSEDPEHLVFNGAAGALTEQHPLQTNVGETVRIFFGVGGPNLTSSFHVIGEIFDRVYEQASLTSPPLTNVQTTTVPPGGAAIVEFAVEVPGRYILVDHALARVERGLAGFLLVEGADKPEVFREGPAQ